VLDLRIYTAI